MAKTALTVELEKNIYKATTFKRSAFGCFEVTIGWYGKQRVDYLTYDAKGNWRCYEIKVSKSDFRSKAHNTFVGHYNYYVMTSELYEQVKAEIPPHIGVYVDSCLFVTKSAKKQPLGVDEEVLFKSMVRSLFREAQRVFASQDVAVMTNLLRVNDELRKKLTQEQREHKALKLEILQRFGRDWQNAEV